MTKAKGGAARKAPDGLDVAIYLRGDQALSDGIDRIVERRRAEHPGLRISRADVMRGILLEATTKSDAEAAAAGKRKGAKS